MSIFQRIITPILYVCCLPLLVVGMVIVIMYMERTVGLSGINEPAGLLFFLLIPGTFFFWIMNRVMLMIEKIRHPRPLDHFRQASLYYAAVIYALFSFQQNGFLGGLGQAFVIMVFIISLWAIVVNAAFIGKMRGHRETTENPHKT